jgi:hypothetical protein
MTEKNLAAHRENGAHSQGAVTPEGKARVATVNLRHGFYAKAQNGALAALGEDPQDYADLMSSLENNLVEGLESELVQRIGDTLWKMRRTQRVQKGVDLKRLKDARDTWETKTLPMSREAYDNLDCSEAMLGALTRRGKGPTAEEIQIFVENFNQAPSEEMQDLFVLLKSLHKLPQGKERRAARLQARARVQYLMECCQTLCTNTQEQLDEMQSPENLAALMAPQDERSLLMQRMEDSNLRRLWRLTNILFRVRNGPLTVRDVKNEGTSGDVYENKGNDDKMSAENAGFLQENAPNEQ